MNNLPGGLSGAEAPSPIEASVRKYGPEIFQFLSDRDIALLLALRDPERSLTNRQLALLLLEASPETRQRTQANLDAFRRAVIVRVLAGIDPLGGETPASEEAREAIERLARTLAHEISDGRIGPLAFPGPRFDMGASAVLETRPWEPPGKPAPSPRGLLRLLRFSPTPQAGKTAPPTLPDAGPALLFDCLTATPEACIGFWVSLHKEMRNAGTAPLAAVVDRLDPFSRSLAILVLERHEDAVFLERSRELHRAQRERFEAYYRRAEAFFSVFQGNAPIETPVLLERLRDASPGPDLPELPPFEAHAPLQRFSPDMEPAAQIVALAHLHRLAREKGLISLEAVTDSPEGQCPVMLCGLNVLCAVCDPELLREAVRLKTKTLMADWERRTSMVLTALSPGAMASFWFTPFALMEAQLAQCRDPRDYLR
ncbi:hypothetical protein NNJEOMEG_02760 [Fundidesulfovibrio magnetotacticus]|uniref:Uncharacterized protein n=1 Tax=Fundidesulfovibrio magnetotacticus TaxID=2730080 RepID=A0A6V8LQY7_9BACT|nr:hypothetical protein [Fundidesulfovibrio magnetotacticus]GFK94912.1 hypothetical protein NNJEOMEG_02760 [Fundidesulfovibrio magnetotacticus]